jgi:hypothetical protein
MLVACRLAGLSALEAHHAGVHAHTQCAPEVSDVDQARPPHPNVYASGTSTFAQASPVEGREWHPGEAYLEDLEGVEWGTVDEEP